MKEKKTIFWAIPEEFHNDIAAAASCANMTIPQFIEKSVAYSVDLLKPATLPIEAKQTRTMFLQGKWRDIVFPLSEADAHKYFLPRPYRGGPSRGEIPPSPDDDSARYFL